MFKTFQQAINFQTFYKYWMLLLFKIVSNVFKPIKLWLFTGRRFLNLKFLAKMHFLDVKEEQIVHMGSWVSFVKRRRQRRSKTRKNKKISGIFHKKQLDLDEIWCNFTVRMERLEVASLLLPLYLYSFFKCESTIINLHQFSLESCYKLMHCTCLDCCWIS